MLHPDFSNIVSYARKLGFAVAITSNGFLLNDEIVERISEWGIFNLLISLHSVRDSTYSKMFGVNRSVKSVLMAIQKLRMRDVPVQVSFTATKYNIDEFGEVKEVLGKLGVNGISIKVVHERGDGSDLEYLMPTEKQLSKVFLDNPEQIQVRTRRNSDVLTCVAGRSLASIDFLGNVHPCTIFEYPVGNIKEKSFKEIWETSLNLQKIRAIRDEDFPVCLQCEMKKYCEVCIARNYLGAFHLS